MGDQVSTSEPQAGGVAVSPFDFQIRSFITPRLLRPTYVIAVVLILIQGTVWFLALGSRDGNYVLVAVTVVPLATIVLLLLARISVEAITVLYQIRQDIARIADAVTERPSTP